jgi:exopolyphosphatase/guanosine-5'-triphosphate,3'-diphosphate pyrophosphatase
VENIRIIATSAARDAVNQTEFLQAVQNASGLQVDIISGEQEAGLAFRGVASEATLEGQRLCILEVGGGSAQIIIGEGERLDFAQSFKLGGVRLLEQFPLSVPPVPAELLRCREWLKDFISREILPMVATHLSRDWERTQFVGVGSTAKALMRTESLLNSTQRDHLKEEGIPISTVTSWVEQLWEMSLSERKRLVGLKKRRADVIPFGAAIVEAVMGELDFTRLRVSKRGIRHAAVQPDA